ncbi:MAG: histidinol-phosphate transaminase [Gammaproteobacteria bacterium]|nr:MAG: histidinol-phosphate transaminase [Gammaproteobacteria bacterium]RLA22912.1 MAG: histidinol-phosphate transaminase [Gammaproteobacteria bacterium]
MEKTEIIQLATPAIQKLQPYQPGKPISELERELGLEEIIKLASNENPLGTNPKVQAVIQENLTELTRYPDGNGFELKRALAQKLNVDVEQITLGNGSNDVLDLIARTFLTTESEALFSEYAFAVYPISTQAVGAMAAISPAGRGESWMKYGHDLDAMAARINEKTGVIFVANPNNPTGTWFGKQQLESFLNVIPSHVIIVLDEAYFEYVKDSDYPDATRYLAQYPNLIVTRTFSKAHGLAGLRVGYSLSSAEIADLLNRVRQPFNVNSLALLAAEVALNDDAYLEETRRLNGQGVKQLTEALTQQGFNVIPSAGNFICVDFGKPAMPLYEALLKKGVIVRPLANYGLPNHLRISIGSEYENQFFINALASLAT